MNWHHCTPYYFHTGAFWRVLGQDQGALCTAGMCRDTEYQLIIAFPQRDIHIDTLKPLEVKVKQE